MDERPVPDENLMPMGMAMSLAMNPPAMKAFSLMSAEEQDAVMEKARRVESKTEMEALVEQLPSFSD